MSARIISVANIKGGVSKTSTGIFLATALAQNKGKKVLYLDCDSQESASRYRQWEKQSMDIEEPYRIRKTDPTFIFEVISDNRASHDIIFIDLPRLTRAEDDQKIGMILTLCDSVLVPITSGELDNMSTADFVKILKRIDKEKQKGKHSYKYAGFASMIGRVPSEDRASREFMKSLKIPILENGLPHLKMFMQLETYKSMLDLGKERRERFEPFFNEVVDFLNL